MKEVFDARARALAAREIGNGHTRTERVLICEVGGQRWALPCHTMKTVVEATPLASPPGVSWRRYPCIGFLCWEVTVYPVIDFAQVLESGPPGELAEESLYALLRTPCLSLRLPRATTLKEISLEDTSLCDHPSARAKIDDLYVLDWKCLT
jgi:hypothetical protein